MIATADLLWAARGEHPAPAQQTGRHAGLTGVLPQLLNPIQKHELNRFLDDPRWCAQEKYDGRRVLIRKSGIQITGTNRHGLVTNLSPAVVRAARGLPGNFLLDGASVGDVVYVFDALQIADQDLRRATYQQRLIAIGKLLRLPVQRNIRVAQSVFVPARKREWCNRLRRENKQGIVFKRLDARYRPGRPASGGPALEYEFHAKVSAVVAQVNPERSVELRLLNCQGWIPVGKVPIPVNQPVPQRGDVVQVQHLSDSPQSMILCQPVYLGRRSDIEPHECIMAQLRCPLRGQQKENQRAA